MPRKEIINENVIKEICKELNITYKKLADEIGYEEPTIRTLASKGQITSQLARTIQLYKENIELKKKLDVLKQLKEVLNDI